MQAPALRPIAPTGAQLPGLVRCLWAEVRMLQRCLGETELQVAPDGDSSPGELAIVMVDLRAEKAKLMARIRAGEAVVVTTPVTTEAPPAPVQTAKKSRIRVTVSTSKTYRRSRRPRVSMAPLRLSLGSGRRSRGTVRRRR